MGRVSVGLENPGGCSLGGAFVSKACKPEGLTGPGTGPGPRDRPKVEKGHSW